MIERWVIVSYLNLAQLVYRGLCSKPQQSRCSNADVLQLRTEALYLVQQGPNGASESESTDFLIEFAISDI